MVRRRLLAASSALLPWLLACGDSAAAASATEGGSEGASSGTTEIADTTAGTTTGDAACELSTLGAVVPVGEGCCGCLCGASGWSCAADTCLTPEGTALALAPEAGFFQLDPYIYAWQGEARSSPRSRVWYAFWPADDEPAARPLLVLFNGGPGAASGLLFGANTAPWSLDPQLSDAATPTAQPWTQAFNLLYIDAPSTGFSYNLPLDDGTKITVALDPDQDASAFISVLLRFLARHPAIQRSPVILLGESYGGTRGVLILEQLLDYEALVDGASPYQNPSVHGEIERHLASLVPESCGRGVTREAIAGQFGRLVSVQGLVAGIAQLVEPVPPGPLCVVDGDPYHCDRPDGWLFDVMAEIGDRLRQPELLATALGVDPTTIAWLHADARVGAYGRDQVVDEGAMVSSFGDLGPGDAYYVAQNPAVGPRPDARSYLDVEIGDLFLRAAATVEVLVTDARLDAVIYTPLLRAALAARKRR
ncbi:MAG: hypothetical protein H6710_07745 [Myxococcales bacterium]|nr:hypothetical protein [Myxococcales bacterium]